jgi:thiol-disulfide isomerase/thioredoxin
MKNRLKDFKYMRSSLIVGLLLANTLLFSCGNKGDKNHKADKPGKFTIEGKFENGAGRSLYLQKIGNDNFISLDTVKIDEKGRFSFKETTSGPDFFIIKTEDGPFINLLLYGREKVKITADYKNILNYTVEGSPESQKIKELATETNRVISAIDRFNIVARDSVNSPDYAKLRLKINEDYLALMAGLKLYCTSFIDTNSRSLISLIALYSQVGSQMMVFNPVKDLKVYEKVDSSLFAIYPQHRLVLSLHEYIAVIKAQIAAQQQAAPGTLAIGVEVPDISLPSPEGKIIKLSSLRGKIVLLDFWASWCQPCRRENPTLVENYAKYHAKGFEIYQVSLDRTQSDWVNGIKQDQLNWTHVSDLKYWGSSVVPQFNIQGIPMNYLLDKEGRVIAGNLRGPALEEKLKEIFNE